MTASGAELGAQQWAMETVIGAMPYLAHSKGETMVDGVTHGRAVRASHMLNPVTNN